MYCEVRKNCVGGADIAGGDWVDWSGDPSQSSGDYLLRSIKLIGVHECY